MNTEKTAQIVSLLMFLENLSVSLRQYMNAQTVTGPSPNSTVIISSMTRVMTQTMLEAQSLAIESEAGGNDDHPF